MQLNLIKGVASCILSIRGAVVAIFRRYYYESHTSVRMQHLGIEKRQRHGNYEDMFNDVYNYYLAQKIRDRS